MLFRKHVHHAFALLATLIFVACSGSGNSIFPPSANGRAPQTSSSSGPRHASAAGAAPALVQQSNGANSASTVTVTYASAPATGDVLVVFLHNNGANSGGGNTYTPPAGWTQIDVDTAHSNQTYEAFYHVTGASEPTSYIFTPTCLCKQHVWDALEFSGISTATPIDKHGFNFSHQPGSWITPSETPSLAGDLAVVAMLPGSSLTWTNSAGWTVDIPAATVWSGEILQEALTTTSPVSESSRPSGATKGYAAIVLLNPGVTTSPPPTSSPNYTDWNTFGDNLQRTGDNPNETTLSQTNVANNGLKVAWSAALDGGITAQPILATNVSIAGMPTNVVYVGTENNSFYAVNADTGAVLWKNTSLGPPVVNNCTDLPGNTFGVSGTATFDKNAGLVYVADANDYVHALSMTTGVEQWKTNVLTDPNTGTTVGAPNQDHIYGALALNTSLGLLYTYTASFCDNAPWHGRIVAINTSTHNVTAAFFPGRTGSGTTGTVYCGAGIWGMGGASVDANTNDVFVATGNIIDAGTAECPGNAAGETYPYGDAVIELDPNLNLLSYQTATANGIKASNDSDYGATPMVYTTGCGVQQTSTKNKNGYVYTYGESNALTFEQQIQIAPTTSGGQFIGVPAFDPNTGMVYVGDPAATGNFANGLNAFTTSGCSGLTLSWKANIGAANTSGDDNQAPSVGDGIVFFTDGIDNQLWAFNDATGAVLWHSGTLMGSPCPGYGTACGVFGAPLVDGHVFVGSWNHTLYAFSL